MRSTWIGLVTVLGLGALSSSARAQDGGFSDPFFLYYGFYLPRQAALAAQPQPEDYVRAQVSRRQESVQTERAGLYDPIGTVGLDELDPTRPFGSRSGSRGRADVPPSGITSTHTRGGGPPGYFNRTDTYFPGRRTVAARSRRAPVVSTRGIGGGAPRMGGYGMPSMNPMSGVPNYNPGGGVPSGRR